MPRKRTPHEVDSAKIEENAQSPEMTTFAKTLNYILAEKGIHQEDMAQALDISTGSISSYRNGKKEPRLSMIIRIADYLGVDCHYLMTGIRAENATAARETGLSGNAVEFLKHEYAVNPLYWHMDAINFLLENKYFQLLLDMIIGVATSKGEKIPYTVESNGFAPIVTDTDIFHAKAVDLFGSVLSDSKEYFSGKKDLRAFYGLYYYAYKKGSSLDAIKVELEKQGAAFDEKMFTTKKRDEEQNNGQY